MKSSQIISGGLIIVSSFLMYYFILPNIQTIKLKNENIQKLNRFIEDAKSIQARRDDLKDQHNQISEKTLKYIKDILPVFSDSTLAQGLIDLSSIAKNSGLNKADTLISISGEQGIQSNISSDIKETTITVSANTSVDTLYNFIQQLNIWSRLIVIESVEINSLKDSIDVRIVIKIKMLFT